jgi:hypothetical protein
MNSPEPYVLDNASLDVEISFTSSKTLEPRLKGTAFSIYRICSIPTAKESILDTYENLLLKFQDKWREGQINSNPEKEGDYVLSLLSLIMAMKVEFNAIKINNVQGTLRKKRSSFLMGKMELPDDLEELVKKLQGLNTDLLRQYLRSCDAYRTALHLIDDNPTLSFFLLVTSIEAISNRLRKSGSLKRNFKEFILACLPKSFEDELGSRELLVSLLGEAYNMRCAFTHGGKGISIGTLSADNVNRNYVKHYVENKEVCSPSITWFERVVRVALLEFLRKQKVTDGHDSALSRLAREEGVIYLKTARNVESGQIVTTSDVDLDFHEKK